MPAFLRARRAPHQPGSNRWLFTGILSWSLALASLSPALRAQDAAAPTTDTAPEAVTPQPEAQPQNGTVPQPVPVPPTPPANGTAPTPQAAPGTAAPPAAAAPQAGAAPSTGTLPVPPPPAPPSAAPEVVYEGQPRRVTAVGGAAPVAGPGQAATTTPPAGPTATLMYPQTEIETILDDLYNQTGVRVRAQGAVRGQKVEARYVDQPIEGILNQLTTPRQWIWVQQADGSYDIYDKDTYVKQVQAQQVVPQVFQLRFIDAEELGKVIEPTVTPEIGSVAVDARSNKLIVTDLPSKLALIQNIINEYDIQLFSQIFEIRNAKVADIGDQLDKVKSKSAELYVDPTHRVIIAKDTFDKLKIMEQLVKILDRDVDMRVYNLNNIGEDGKIATDFIEKFVTPILSEDAVSEYNEITGKLFVRDIGAVQEKITQMLEKLDVPRKQVLIQGEVLEAQIKNTLNYGVELAYSPDLTGAIETGQGDITSFNGSTDASEIKKGLPLVTTGSGGLTVLSLTDHVKAQLSAALTDANTRVLSRPQIFIANNEEGTFEVTENQPILQTYFNNSSTSSNNSSYESQSTVSSGLTITITPRISNRGLIEMTVSFENSAPIIVEDIGNGIRGIGTTGSSAETVLLIPSGETRVIGGLISRDHSDSQGGVPVLSRIPYLGALFGSISRSDTSRDLMFFITPTIVNERTLNDDLVEPVNDVAKMAMETVRQATAAPEAVNEIPEELRPYLRQIRPEAAPMPGAEATTGTTSSALRPQAGEGATTLTLSNDALTTAMQLLKNEPYRAAAATTGTLRVGGAVPTTAAVKGPSGVFGATARTGGAVGTARTRASQGATTGTTGIRNIKPVQQGTASRKTTSKSEKSSTGGGSTRNTETKY